MFIKRNFLKINYKTKIFHILFNILIIFFYIKLLNKNNYKRCKILKKGRNYLNKCLSGILIKKNIKNINKLIEKPKISIIIPSYNSNKTIKNALRSIQNQNMVDIEIILVNDFSNDNSLNLVLDMQKEDNRIKIINNNRNRGILYSRCIGVLKSKGKYILTLDQDDLFFDFDVFDTIYNKAKETNCDIISFMEVVSDSYYSTINNMKDGYCTRHHSDNLIVLQPKLTYYAIFKNEKFYYNDVQIWGKLIKDIVYKKAIKLLGIQRYSIYNIFNEDMIQVFVICNVASSYIYLRKYGIFHLIKNPNSAIHKSDKDHRVYMIIFLSDIIYDFSNNNYKKYSAIYLNSKISRLSFFNNFSKKNKNFLLKVLKKIIKCKYIEEKYKTIIRKKYRLLRKYKIK